MMKQTYAKTNCFLSLFIIYNLFVCLLLLLFYFVVVWSLFFLSFFEDRHVIPLVVSEIEAKQIRKKKFYKLIGLLEIPVHFGVLFGRKVLYM